MRVRAANTKSILLGMGIALTLVLASGCAGMTPVPFDPNRTTDDIPEGPGLFTGEKGAWIWTEDSEKQKETEAATHIGKAGEAAPPSLENQLEKIDRKLKELEHQQQELEQLKQEVKDSLESSFKHNSNTSLQWVA